MMRKGKSDLIDASLSSAGSINENLYKACYELLEQHPEHSVKTGLTRKQMLFLFITVTALIVAVSLNLLSFHKVIIGFSILFTGQILFRFYAAVTHKNSAASTLAPTSSSALPTFTILVPLYKEEAVVKRSVDAMRSMNYPANLVEVFYLTEADDLATEVAVEKAISGSPFKLVSVPPQAPRTKPKALNFGLKYASGDIITIYDAEDIPHPDQLMAVALTYIKSEKNLAVVQCPLHAYNGAESWISSQFDLEYAIHFDVWLPAMTKLNWPIPLGGTSNHFDRDVLQKVGAWDPYNVTEDADLGFRLAQNGYAAEMVPYPTLEEAPLGLKQWLPQRTRWIKGHIQSLFVLTRFPKQVINRLGFWNCFGVLITFASAIFASALHGPFVLYSLYTLLFQSESFHPLYLLPLVLGFISVVLAAHMSSARDRKWKALITAPIYWPLMSIAFLNAIWELKTKPFNWSKTQHGVSKFNAPSLYKQNI